MKPINLFCLIAICFVLTPGGTASEFEVEQKSYIRRCGKDTPAVAQAHQNAISAHESTNQALLRPFEILSSDSTIRDGLNRYFRIDLANPADLGAFHTVAANIRRLAQNAHRTIYICNSDRGLYCGYSKSTVAVVPPPKHRVRLCDNFFDCVPNEQAGILIHEWGHRFGKRYFDYLDETYCFGSDRLNQSELIRQPDQYMMFILWVAGQGRDPGCFKRNLE